MHVSLAMVLTGQLIMVAYSKQILLGIYFMPTVTKQTCSRVQDYYQPVRVTVGRDGLDCPCFGVGTALLERLSSTRTRYITAG